MKKVQEYQLNKGVIVNNKTKEALKSRGISDTDILLMDFSDKDLSGLDLSEAILVNAKFINSNLTDLNLAGANIWRADFSGATMTGIKGTCLQQLMTARGLHRAHWHGSEEIIMDLIKAGYYDLQ